MRHDRPTQQTLLANSWYVPGDFDGDGKDDLTVVTASGNPGVNVTTLLSTGSAFSGSSPGGLWYTNSGVDIANSRYITGDYNADGKADLAVVTPSGNPGINVTTLLSTGSAFSGSSPGGLWYQNSGVLLVGSRYA